MDTLHIYSQECYHDAVYVVGDLNSLRNLRDTLNQAIDNFDTAKFNTFANDGEGYTLMVIPATEPEMDQMKLPYYGEIAMDHRKQCKWPWQVASVKSDTCLEVSAEVRYWENAKVSGQRDEDGTLIPFRNGEYWQPVIRLRDGQILNWPKGITANVHYKVCDGGEYWISKRGQRLYKYNDYYVPNEYLCHGYEGDGDYIILKIGPDGKIEDWKEPKFHSKDWTPCN